MEFAPPCPTPPDMICPIIFCMLGSDIIVVAMFIKVGLFSKLPMSKPPGPEPNGGTPGAGAGNLVKIKNGKNANVIFNYRFEPP